MYIININLKVPKNVHERFLNLSSSKGTFCYNYLFFKERFITDIILNYIKNAKELSLLSDAYLKGMIKLNISKLAAELIADRKTVR